MADDIKTPAEPVASDSTGPVDLEAAPAEVPVCRLPVKAWRVVKTNQRSSANEPIDILEVEFSPLAGGNFAWHNWHDCARMSVERAGLEKAIAMLGLK